MPAVDWENIKGDWIDIKEDGGYPLGHFVIPSHYQQFLAEVLVPHGLILDRIDRLAEQIVQSNPGPLHVMCVLAGGHQFFSDLVNAIKKLRTTSGKFIPMTLDFIRASSYVNDASTGNVKLSLSESQLQALKGKNLLLVEDMIDSGQTMVALLNVLNKYEPKSVKVAAMTVKKTDRNTSGYIPEYVGFLVPDSFLVGFSLDYNDAYRDLDHICNINEAGKKEFAVPRST